MEIRLHRVDQKVIDAYVHFVLQFEGITGFASAGDIRLLPDAVNRFGEMTNEEMESTLSRLHPYESPFDAPASIV